MIRGDIKDSHVDDEENDATWRDLARRDAYEEFASVIEPTSFIPPFLRLYSG